MRISSLAYRRLGNSFFFSQKGIGVQGRQASSFLLGNTTIADRHEEGSSNNSILFTKQQQGQRVFQSTLSSFAEPGTLFDVSSNALSGSSSTSSSQSTDVLERDAQLRADVRTMGRLLGHIITKHHGIEIFNTIEKLRHLAKQWRESGSGRSTDPVQKQDSDELFEQLNKTCEALSTEELLLVSRAFTHFLAIVNAAEGHHRIRLLSSSEQIKEDSCAGVIDDLLAKWVNGKEITAESIMDSLSTQTVELVLTAHPTQVNRRTILEKQRRVQEVCTRLCNMPFCLHSLTPSN